MQCQRLRCVVCIWKSVNHSPKQQRMNKWRRYSNTRTLLIFANLMERPIDEGVSVQDCLVIELSSATNTYCILFSKALPAEGRGPAAAAPQDDPLRKLIIFGSLWDCGGGWCCDVAHYMVKYRAMSSYWFLWLVLCQIVMRNWKSIHINIVHIMTKS